MQTLKLSAVLVSLVVVAGCPEKDDRDSPMLSGAAPAASAPTPTPAPTPAPTPVPTPEAAVAVVEQFYGQYQGKLTPTLTALFTDTQRARAEAHAKLCGIKDVEELPAACESDPYICAQDDLKMGKPTFEAPTTVVVASTVFPELKVKLAMKDVGGSWKIDGFTCPAP
jgi:hypothetical protein